MAKKIDWEKVKYLSEKRLSPPEIAKKMNITVGTLYNNKSKWNHLKIKSQEESKKEAANELVENVISDKNILEVKEFYKNTLRDIRKRITGILKEKACEESFRELQVLEKLMKILKEARHIDYTVNDILSYTDLVSLEVAIKKLELESIRLKKR